MASTTSGGSTLSFSNTPQATDDVFAWTEDRLLASSLYTASTNTLTLDVMSNDLGGAAKALWSVDDGNGNALAADFELVAGDVLNGASAWEKTALGNWVRINNCKIEYRISDGSGTPGAGSSIDTLAAGHILEDQFVYAIRLGNGTLSQARVSLAITGANDAVAITTADALGSVVEDAATTPSPTDSLTATGTIAFADVDLQDLHTATFAPAAANATALGTFALAPVAEAANAAAGSVAWTYTLDNAAAQYLAAGQSVVEHFTVTIDDQNGATATQDVAVTIVGVNDGVAIASGAQAGAVVEDAPTTPSPTDSLTATGTIAFADVDLQDLHTATFAPAAANATALGTFAPAPVAEAANAAAGSVAWTYTLDNAAAQYLAAGQSVIELFTVTIDDQNGATATQDVAVTIVGVNDGVAIASGAQAGAVVEDAPTTPSPTDSLTATGTIAFADVDLQDLHTATFAPAAANATALGRFALAPVAEAANAAAGSVAWTYTLDNAAAQYLAAGQSVIELFTVTIDDQNGATATQDVAVTIVGVNDGVAIASGAQAGLVVEDAPTTPSPTDSLTATGTIAFADVDLQDLHTATFAPAAANATALGRFALAPVAEAANTAAGSVQWTYTLDNAAAQYLAAGQSVVEHFTVTIDDQNGATATQDVAVTIVGVNDAPVITAELGDSAGGTLAETDSGLTLAGTLTASDADLADIVRATPILVAASGPTGGLTDSDLLQFVTVSPDPVIDDAHTSGKLTWRFDSGAQAFDFLASGETLTLSYTIRPEDGHLQTGVGDGVITIHIQGSDDNHPPEVEADKFVILPTGAAATSLRIAPPVDPDGDLLTITLDAVPSQGALRLGAQFGGALVSVGQQLTLPQLSSLTYSPPSGGPGYSEVLQYTVSDGALSSSARVVIDVRATGVADALYLSATDGVSGNELWKVDPSGIAFRLADIAPGSGSSNPSTFVLHKNELYFVATNSFGAELWKLSTSGVVQRVTDLGPGIQSGSPYGLTSFADELYFGSSYTGQLHKLNPDGSVVAVGAGLLSSPQMLGVVGDHLFVTGTSLSGGQLFAIGANGAVETVSGTPDGSSNPANFTYLNGAVYFSATDGVSGAELWKIGLTGGATRVADINPGAGASSPASLTVHNGELYFTAANNTFGVELWKISNAGLVQRITDIAPGSQSASPYGLTSFNGELYFGAFDGSLHLYKVTNAGAVVQVGASLGLSGVQVVGVVADKFYFTATGANGGQLFAVDQAGAVQVVNGTADGSSTPTGFTIFGDAIYFAASNGVLGTELWKISGDGPPVLVADINPGQGSSNPAGFLVWNGELYFAASNVANGSELWKVTSSGVTQLAANLAPGAASSSPYGLTEFNGALYFGATASGETKLYKLSAGGAATAVSGSPLAPSDLRVFSDELYFAGSTPANGAELWKVKADGSVALVLDINAGAPGSSPKTFFEFNGALFFAATTAAAGTELWKIGPTGAPQLVRDLTAGAAGSNPANLIGFNGELYFTANDPVAATSGSELWKVTAAGDVVLAGDIFSGTQGSNPSSFALYNGELYFAATDVAGAEVWKVKADGTLARVADINPGASGSSPANLTVFNGALYFTATTPASGQELWKIVGANPPVLVADIFPGASGSSIASLTAFTDGLYFRATSGDGAELWKIALDGSLLKQDINNLLLVSGASGKIAYLGEYYFTATDPLTGVELWKLTADGKAVRVADLRSGSGSSSPSDFNLFNNELYFTAREDDYGSELYKVKADGSVVRVADLVPGFVGSNPSGFTVYKGEMYFSASDVVSSFNTTQPANAELWKINAAGALVKVAEIAAGASSSNPRGFTLYNDELYFAASDAGAAGDELWKVKADGTLARVADLNPGASGSSPGNLTVFNGALYFTATTPAAGQELWKIVGANPPVLVADIFPGASGSSIASLTAFTDGLYFRATSGDGAELWKIALDGSLLKQDINNLLLVSGASGKIAYLGEYYFTATDPLTGVELWKLTADGKAVRVADLRSGSGSSSPSDFNLFNNELYFTAREDDYGSELYKVKADGSVVRVADLVPGFVGSNPSGFTVYKGEMYFSASDMVSSFNTTQPANAELWKINAAGALVKVAEIAAGASSSNPRGFTLYNDELYFAASDAGAAGDELWKVKADGTLARVADINPGASGSSPANLTVFNGALYFTATTPASGQELWKIVGANPPVLVADIFPGASGSSIAAFKEFHGELFFRATSANGAELWKIALDGSLLKQDINNLLLVSGASGKIAYLGEYYFTATDPLTGVELWKLTADGKAVRVADLRSGSGSSSPSDFNLFNNELYFTAREDDYGSELYKVKADGSVVRVADLVPGFVGSNPSGFTVYKGEMYFSASDMVSSFNTTQPANAELWKINAAGALVKVAEIAAGASSSNPRGFTLYNDELYFAASDAGAAGDELWKVKADGTLARVADINPGASGSSPANLTVFNGALYFTATTPASGQELWKIVGANPPVLVADIFPGASGSSIASLTAFTDGLYFRATSGDGAELWKIALDGSLLKQDINNLLLVSGASGKIAYLGEYYFTATDPLTGVELWKLTADGKAVRVADLRSGSGSSSPSDFNLFNNELYFTAREDDYGSELYKVKADGSVVRVADLVPGFVGSNPSGFTVYKGEMYFSASDMVSSFNTTQPANAELWKINAAGALVKVAEIAAGASSSNPRGFTLYNDELYFAASDTGAAGDELWKVKADGTLARVADINPGASGSSPANLTVFNGALYFTATTPASGQELWKIVGANPPVLVADIFPGASGSSIAAFKEFHGELFFRATSANGAELWKIAADGSVVNVADINAGPNGSAPSNFLIFDETLYFTADNGVAGSELWRVTPGGGVEMAAEFNSGAAGSSPSGFIEAGGQVYFTATDSVWGTELWTLKPGGEVQRLTDVAPNAQSTSPYGLTAFHGELYFGAGYNGQIYRVKADGSVAQVGDGSASGSQIMGVVEDHLYFTATTAGGSRLFALGADGSLAAVAGVPNGSSSPANFTVFGAGLYFTAADGAGVELWKIGEGGAPTRVADINPGAASSSPQGFVLHNNAMYFTATNAFGAEVWKLSAAGDVQRVTDIAPGAQSTNPYGLTSFNGDLYFGAAYNGQLYKLDAAGVSTPIGVGSLSSPQILGVVSDKLYVSATGPNGGQLFALDGAGAVQAVAGSVNGSSNPLSLFSVENGAAPISAFGGDGDDILVGGVQGDTLAGAGGDDLLFGGGGDDAFVFSGDFGRDTILDFAAGASGGDVVVLPNVFADFEQLFAHARQDGGDVVIVAPAAQPGGAFGEIILKNVVLGTLTAGDFTF